MKRTKPRAILDVCPLDGITFNFKEQLDLRKVSMASTTSYQSATSCGFHSNSDSSRESDNSLYQIPCVPKQFMDSSAHSEDLNYLSASRESDQISLSSTASSCGYYYPKRPDSGGIPLYIPMNKGGGYSPGSNNKVSVSVLMESFNVFHVYNVQIFSKSLRWYFNYAYLFSTFITY